MNRLVQRLVDAFIKASAIPDPLPNLECDGPGLIFVYTQRYWADRLAVRQSLQAQGIEAAQMLGLPLDGGQEKHFDRAVSALFGEDADVQIVPVSVFWGRRPVKESSIWRVIFSDNWAVPGIFVRFLTVLTQGRRVECYFSHALSLDEFRESATAGDDLGRKLKRVLRTHFRRQREAVVGPDLSHRRTMQLQVLTSPQVLEALANEPNASEKKARKYLNEIASDYSYAVLRIFEYFLNWLWKKLYGGVTVKGMKSVHDLATDHELIYVPCHRSHIDYLLLSYVIYRQGLMPPHIAAGINLNMPLVGSLLRRAGAFFIRRQFRGNQLYRAVLEAYLASMCQKGFPIEYFVEGGRSRTGRLLQPRLGMLMMTLDSVRHISHRPMAFVPVYIGYERILESHSYINELYGKSKKKESIKGLLSASRHLRENYGRVHVNFGEPIHEQQIWRAIGYQGEAPPEKQSDAFRHGVSWLGRSIMTGINAHAEVLPVNLVATILLGTPKHALLESQLPAYLDAFCKLSTLSRLETVSCQPRENWSSAIAHAEQLGLFKRNSHAMGDIVLLDQRGAIAATYLRNNTLHCFVLAGVVAEVLITRHRASIRRLQDLCRQLYPYLKNEYFLPWQVEEIPAVVREVLALFLSLGLLTNEGGYYQVPAMHSEARHLLSIIASASKGPLERFYITLQLLITKPQHHYSAQTLEADCVLMAQRLSMLNSFHAPDFFDKNLFRTFIQSMIDQGMLHEDSGARLAFDRRIALAEKRFAYVLSPEVRLGILQITRH